MVDEDLRKEAAEDFAAFFADETGFGAAWALLWLIVDPARHAEALALIDDEGDDDLAAGEALREWAEPQLVEFRRGAPLPTILWRHVVKILRDHLPPPVDEG